MKPKKSYKVPNAGEGMKNSMDKVIDGSVWAKPKKRGK